MGASFTPVRGAAQLDGVIRLQSHQHAVEHTGPLALCHAVHVKSLCCSRCRLVAGRAQLLARLGSAFACRLVQTALERINEQARVVKIALPEQCRTFTRQTVGGVGGHGVICHYHTAWRGQAAFAAPCSLVVSALVLPLQHVEFLRDGETKKSARRSGPLGSS